MRHLLQLLLLTCLAPSLGAAPTWLAVSPDPKLTTALEPLAEHRRSQGFKVTIASTSVEEAIATLGGPPDFLLIVGSDQLVPAKRGQQYRWLSTQQESFAADPLFSDLDDDGIPEFPVGRIPAETPDQLAAVVKKIITYENRELGIADLNLPVWSGTPAYGKLLDETADWLLMTTLDKYAPDWAQPWLITANPNNPLNAWPADQSKLFNQQIQKGAAFTAMMGHGATDLFLSMEVPKEIVYTNRDTTGLEKVSPPLVIFACDCGNFAHKRRQSLAAALLLGTGGPVATIAATTESHPLTNYYSSISLMQQLAKSDAPDRTGNLWLATQLDAQKMRKPIIERLLKNVEGSLDVEIDIAELKRDQLQMYAFLGDPALKLNLPTPLAATFTKGDDGSWKWTAEKPPGPAKLIVQFRPKTKPLRSKPADTDRQQSLKLFEERNALFGYKTLATIKNTDAWTAEIKDPGDIRLIVLGKEIIQVATKTLK